MWLPFYNYELCAYIYTLFVFSSINLDSRFVNLRSIAIFRIVCCLRLVKIKESDRVSSHKLINKKALLFG